MNIYLGCWWQVSVDIVDLFLESAVQHFVGLIKNEKFDVSGTEISSSNHIESTTGSTYYNVLTKVKLADVLANVGTTNADVGLDVHVVTKSQDDLLDLLRQLTSGTEDKSCKSYNLLKTTIIP